MVIFYKIKHSAVSFYIAWYSIVVMVFATGLYKGQQMFTFEQSMGSYVPITNGTTVAEATGNTTATNLSNKYYLVNLPFAFHYIGIDYTSIYISSNGFITLGNPPASNGQINPISYQNTTSAISIFAGNTRGVFNVVGKTARIKTEVLGVAPNRQFVIEWQNFSPGTGPATNNVYAMSYQIRLEESTSRIDMIYGGGSHLVGAQNYTANVQVGIRGAAHYYYKNRKSEMGFPFASSIEGDGNYNTQYIDTNQTGYAAMPTSGLTYTWTPPACRTPVNINITNVTDSTAEASWSVASMPANGFEYYVNNNSNATPPLSSSWVTGTSATTSVQLNNLPPYTIHYFWVRAVCGNVRSDWSLVSVFQTLCGVDSSVNENFDFYSSGPKVPNCWARLVGSDAVAQTISGSGSALGVNDLRQKANDPFEANVVILPRLNNVNSGTHWLRFKTRSEVGVCKMDVGYITDINDASTFVNVQSFSFDNLEYNSASEYMVKFPTNIPSTARIAIRNDGAARRTFFYDDVFWEPLPACSPVIGLKLTNVDTNSAAVNWETSIDPPANGYDIYLSTSTVQPAATVVPLVTGHASNSFTFNNLQPSTVYYVWIRSNCGSGVVGDWLWRPLDFRTKCLPSVLISTTGATICKDGTATISAVADVGANVVWYDAPVGGNVVGVGNTYITPPLAATTTFYAAASTGIGEVRGGKMSLSPSGIGGTVLGSLVFNINVPTILKKITIYPTAEVAGGLGTVTIALSNASDVRIATKKVVVVAGTQAQPLANEVDLDFELPMGDNYKLQYVTKSSDIEYLMYDPNILNNGVTPFPYSLGGYGEITSSQIYTNTPIYYPYYYFYNWVMNGGCESARQPVVVTVDTNCLSTSETTIKEGIHVYPNPFINVVNITNYKEVKSLSITDASGRIVKMFDRINQEINLSELKSGMYIFNISLQNGTSQSVKVIKK